jgi:hypothetical protein
MTQISQHEMKAMLKDAIRLMRVAYSSGDGCPHCMGYAVVTKTENFHEPDCPVRLFLEDKNAKMLVP